jgi:hypothetical protein
MSFKRDNSALMVQIQDMQDLADVHSRLSRHGSLSPWSVSKPHKEAVDLSNPLEVNAYANLATQPRN